MKIVRADQEGPSLKEPATGEAPSYRRLSVLMPVYNEQWTLRDIVARVLTSPVPLEIELVIVDDCSTDGSWDLIRELAAADLRIKPVRHERNAGKGSALRTAIGHITGEVAVVQDADLEYDPHEFPRLLQPILEGKADAVFGSRYAGSERRVAPFWHTMVNKGLTLLSNVVNNLCLTDMETCYKMVRADILTRLKLRSRTFTFEPELTCRLAQWGARIYEVPISYNSRTYLDGKKIRPRDGLLAVGEILRSRFLDPRFTHDAEFYRLSAAARAGRYHRWLAERIRPYLGARVMETGAGVGSLSGLLTRREQLVLVEDDPVCLPVLRQRFGGRQNVRIEHGPALSGDLHRWQGEGLDTVVCRQQDENIHDAMQAAHRILSPGGHAVCLLECVRSVPGGDFDEDRVVQAMTAAGLEIVDVARFNNLGRFWPGQASPRAVAWADRFWPLARLADSLLPLPGRSLLIVGRKPDRAAQRAAA